MKHPIVEKLQRLAARQEEITTMLSDPVVIADQNRFRDLSREYSHLDPVVKLFTSYQQAEADLDAARDMLKDDDAEIRGLGEEEAVAVEALLTELELAVKKHLIPRDPHDDSNIHKVKSSEELDFRHAHSWHKNCL